MIILRGCARACSIAVIIGGLLSACSRDTVTQAPPVYPDPTSTGAKLLAEKCTGCHAPPLPGAHTAREWPGVVFRMQNHRVMTSLKPLTDAEVGQLVEYLQKHAHAQQ